MDLYDSHCDSKSCCHCSKIACMWLGLLYFLYLQEASVWSPGQFRDIRLLCACQLWCLNTSTVHEPHCGAQVIEKTENVPHTEKKKQYSTRKQRRGRGSEPRPLMGVGITIKNHRDPMDKEVPGCLLAGLQRMNVRAHLLQGRKKKSNFDDWRWGCGYNAGAFIRRVNRAPYWELVLAVTLILEAALTLALMVALHRREWGAWALLILYCETAVVPPTEYTAVAPSVMHAVPSSKGFPEEREGEGPHMLRRHHEKKRGSNGHSSRHKLLCN